MYVYGIYLQHTYNEGGIAMYPDGEDNSSKDDF